MCTHPECANIICHADSCLPSLPELKQWYLLMVSFVSFRRTYYGHILSVPSRSSSLMDVDFAIIKIHANRFCRGLGHIIRVGKTKYMQTGYVVVLVMSYSQAKQSIFCCLWPILVVPDVINMQVTLSRFFCPYRTMVIMSE